MDDFGAEMIATAFATKYGKIHADKVRKAWADKQHQDAPRKPTYLLVQKPAEENSLPAVWGRQKHTAKEAPGSII